MTRFQSTKTVPNSKDPIALVDLQTQLQNFLLDKAPLTEIITLETHRFKREERLDIYYQAYRLRLIEALGKDFPAVEKWVGSEKFSEIGLSYIAKYPSTHPSLRWLSQYFVQHLIQQKEAQELIELAQFEWAQVNAFDAQEILPIDENQLKNLAPEEWMEIQLGFHPSVHLLELFTPAPQRWQELEKGIAAESFHDRLDTPLLWVIWRKDLQILFQSCDPLEAIALKRFHKGEKLHTIFEALTESLGEKDLQQLPLQIAGYLQRWIKQGWILSLN